MSGCKVKYIENMFRKQYPELADKLTDIYNQAWRDISRSGLFREYKDNGKLTYLFSKINSEQNKKQAEFIKKLNEKYNVPKGQSLFGSKPTISGYNTKILIDVRPLAQQEYDKIEKGKSQQGRLFQLSGRTETSKASAKTLKIVNDFLNRIGVKPDSVKGIVINGQKIDANAVSDLTQKLIQVVEGKDAMALPEEAMHFFVAIIKQTNPSLYNQLLKEINGFRMLNQVFEDYGNDPNYQTKDGKRDILKLKEEAIGKVLAATIIKKNEGVLEKPENLEKVGTWWERMIAWLKSLIGKSGFDQAALKVLSGEAIGTVDDIREQQGNLFKQKNSQGVLFDKLKQMQATITKEKDGYSINGKKILKRVSDEVTDWYERRFRNYRELTETEYQKSLDDLKKEKGTMAHKFFEKAFSFLVDDDGFIRDSAVDDSSFVNELSENEAKIYKTLKDNLSERLNSFGKTTRFMSEITVYNPNYGKTGIAGTIDFLAIREDGRVSILDWKFIDLNIEKYQDIPWYKVGSWQIQMNQYKSILESAYGVDAGKFEQTRMIPIKTVYTDGDPRIKKLPELTNILIGSVDPKKTTDAYLLPVPLKGERTGVSKVDKLLEKLNDLYASLSEVTVTSDEAKAEKAEQLNALFSAIRQLQLKENIHPLIEQAKILNVQLQKTIDKYNTDWAGKDPNSFEQEEITDFTVEIERAQKAVSYYTNLTTELNYLFKNKELTEEDKKLKEELREIVEDAREFQDALYDIGNNFTSEFIAGSEGVADYFKAEKIVKGLSRWFATTSNIQLKGVETLFKKVNRSLGFAAMDTVTETKKLQELKNEYDKWASSKGLSKKNYFDILKKKNSNELIDEFNPEFYNELQKSIDEKGMTHYNWVQENIDVEAYKNELKKILEERITRIQNKARIRSKDKTEQENDKAIVEEIQKEIEEANQLYSTSTWNSLGWYLYDKMNKFPNRNKWESAEWKTLKQNEPAKKFYDYIVERNKYYASIGYINSRQARIFLPFVRKSLMEKMILGGDIRFGEEFLRSISVDEGDIGYGQLDANGRPINKVPIYFTKEIEGDISTDLFRNMALYNEMAIKFDYVTKIEAQARALVATERNKKAIATSIFGKVITKDGVVQYTENNDDNTELLENMVKAIVYGQRYIQSDSFDQLLFKFGNFGEKINKKMGMKIFPDNLSNRQVTINKALTQLNSSFQLSVLGVNPLSSISNLLGGGFQSTINAGVYFTKTQFITAENMLAVDKLTGRNQKLMVGALEYFLPLTENYNKEIAKHLSISKLSQENIQEFLMIGMRESDKFVQLANFYAFLENTIIDGDKVVNVREYLRKLPEYQDMYVGTEQERKARMDKFEEDAKKLVEEKGVLKLAKIENNEFVIPGVERKSQSVIEVRRKVQQLSKDALGNLSEDDVRNINLNVYGKSFMLFKNWVPRLVDVRAGNLKYNSASDAYEWGRMRMIFRTITEDGIKALSRLSDAMKANDKGVEYMKQLYEKKKKDYETETGKKLNMTESQFMDLVRHNTKAALVDAMFMLTLLGLFAGLKAIPPDDDEDEAVKNQYKFLLRATDKIKDELGYFYDPTGLAGMVSSGIFPSMSYITNFKKLLTNFMIENYGLAVGDEKLVKKNYVIKYLLKTFPFTNQVEGMLPMFYPELAKDLGIKTSTQARPVGM